MAEKYSNNSNVAQSGEQPRKKADVILEKIDCLLSSYNEVVLKADKAVQSTAYLSRQSSEIYERTLEENAGIKQQIKYVAEQTQSVFERMSQMMGELSAKIDALQARVEEQAAAEPEEEKADALDYEAIASEVALRIDYDGIADRIEDVIAEHFAVEEGEEDEDVKEPVTAEPDDGYYEEIVEEGYDDYEDEYDEPSVEIDYELLAAKLAEHMPAATLDADELAQKLAEKLPAQETLSVEAVAQRVAELMPAATAQTDVDEICSRLAASLPVQELVSPDYIAARVAEQIVIPAEVDYEMIGDVVYERLCHDDVALYDEDEYGETVEEDYTPDAVEAAEFAEDESEGEAEAFDYEKLATLVAEKLAPEEISDEDIEEIEETEETYEIDYEKLADMVAERVTVPAYTDEDCEKIATSVVEKMFAEDDYADAGDDVEETEEEYIPDEEEAEEFAQAEEEGEEEEAFDYEKLAALVVEKLAPELKAEENYEEAESAEDDEIVEEVEETVELDYEKLADLVAEKLSPALSTEIEEARQASERGEFDYEKLADLVAERLTEEDEAVEEAGEVEEVEADEASEAVEEAENDEMEVVDLDYEKLASLVAEKLVVPEYAEVRVDEDAIAERVVEKLAAANETEEELAEEEPAEDAEEEAPALRVCEEDMERIIDEISKRVCAFLPEEYDILVDDDGCDAVAAAIVEKLDKKQIANEVAEELKPEIRYNAEAVDYDEMAKQIGEKLDINPNINEDVLADKAAAVLSNYMPEIDTDDMCERIASAVIASIPAPETFDYEGVCDTVSEKVSDRLILAQEDSDYDIVLDDEGVARITESVTVELAKITDEKIKEMENRMSAVEEQVGENIAVLTQTAEERFTKIESDVTEIKELLLSGAVVAAASEIVAAEAAEEIEETEETEEAAEEPVEETVEETVEEVTEEPVETEVTEETAEEEPVEETAEEVAEEAEKAPAEEAEEEPEEELVTVSDVVGEEEGDYESDDVIGEIVDDIDEQPASGEIMPDGIEGISAPVDFANMMKYNRSFIARIIQGSDDVKRYYGATKTALLSYKKVNSSIAWGAERFNKGRETIAKFKIRGKTLCLYLALNPNDYKTSVYHQVDVSDNKSMSTTPMMVKIKSPLGVKKAIRLIDDLLAKRDGVKQNVMERDYVAMYPYETIEELIEDGLVKDVSKK